MRKYLLGLAIFSIIAVSCDRDKDLVKATVIDTMDITQGGCGYILRLENGEYLRPTYLPSAYQSNGLKVKVKYNTNGEEQVCHGTIDGGAVNFESITVIEIAKIKTDLD